MKGLSVNNLIRSVTAIYGSVKNKYHTKLYSLGGLLLGTLLLTHCGSITKSQPAEENLFLKNIQTYIQVNKQKKRARTKQEFKNYVSNLYTEKGWPEVLREHLDCGSKLPSEQLHVIVNYNHGIVTPTSFTKTAKLRLAETTRMFKKYQPNMVVLSGNNHEGAAKYRSQKYAIGLGLKKEKIYIENKSSNTYENVKFSFQYIKESPSWRNILFVSSPYHMDRILRYYEKQFPEGQHKIYWSSYKHQKNDGDPMSKNNQIIHEAYSIVRDAIEYNNSLQSKLCARNKAVN